MRIDWQTLQDLGILRPEGAQLSLYDWANFTCTLRGGELLRDHFRTPMSDVAMIRATQEAGGWLACNPDILDPLLGRSAWQSIERYNHSSFTALDYPNRLFLWIDSWFTRYRHADLFREVAAALALLQALVRKAELVVESLDAIGLPTLIASWREELRECLGSAPLARLRSIGEVHRLTPPPLLALDHALRSESFISTRQFADLIYRIDVLRSLGVGSKKHGLVYPEIEDGDRPLLDAEGLFHPFVEQAVGNPLNIDSEGRLIFLTGPNMAGKSTYLKAAGVAVFLAQIGMGVPARRLRLTPFDCLISGINTTDNLRLGQSYFYREVARVREVADVLDGASALVLFDEMFKGTNLKDAAEACLTVLTAFATCDASAFIVASHIAELAAEIEHLPAVKFRHFGAEIQAEKPVFDYQVREGVSDQRLGMVILEREGVLARLRQLQARAGDRTIDIPYVV